MTCSEGLEKLQHARKNIEVLQERLDWCQTRLSDVVDAQMGNPHFNPMSTYWGRELLALEWALPILEAEWDYLARLRRELEEVEGRHPRTASVT